MSIWNKRNNYMCSWQIIEVWRCSETLVVEMMVKPVHEESNGVTTNGVTQNVMFFDRRTFRVPLPYFYFPPKVTGRTLFPQAVKMSVLLQRPHLCWPHSSATKLCCLLNTLSQCWNEIPRELAIHRGVLRPVRLLRVWISEGLTQADS